MNYESHEQLRWLQNKISQLPLNQQITLKSLKNCSKKIIPTNGHRSGVFLLKNSDNNAKFFGFVTCKNPWACPQCTAQIMNKYTQKIDIALQALNKTHFPFMVTFKIPHTLQITLQESMKFLYYIWKMFVVHGNKNTRKRYNSIAQKFIVENKIKYRIRVAEATYSTHAGWHPHFHCIFWAPYKQKNNILKYEADLNEYCKKLYCNIAKKNLSPEIYETVEKLTQKHNLFYISKNPDGSVIKCLSAKYVTGWSPAAEVGGLAYKTASKNVLHANGEIVDHFTPQELLEKATFGDEKAGEVFIKFILDIKASKKNRVQFSNGLLSIIKQFKSTQEFKEYIEVINSKKKHATDWEIVCWFNAEQWSNICEINIHQPIKANILYLARFPDILHAYLLNFDIVLEDAPKAMCQVVEQIFAA